MEGRNLPKLTIAHSPLLGDENTPLHTSSDNFDSATTSHQITFTSNPLVTSWRQGSLSLSGSVSATPLRDSLSINPADHLRNQQLHTISGKWILKAGFMNLPRPGNNFELLVPDDDPGEGPIVSLSEQDVSDRDEKLKRAQHEEELRVLNRRSQSVQLGLPRPINVDMRAIMQNRCLDFEPDLAHAQELVYAELVKLVHHDSLEYPLPEIMKTGASEFFYDLPDDDTLKAAKIAIRTGLATFVGFPSTNANQLREGLLQNPEQKQRRS